jgi:hypothetical protein
MAVGEDRATITLESAGEREHRAASSQEAVHKNHGGGIGLHDRALHGDSISTHEMARIIESVGDCVDRGVKPQSNVF